ncbi:hypothetical protein A2973_00650 [Candidatus Gottesmanbacteria bacterium RIFCSPLOWO2_01_FULL_49_10]|uniref:Glycosyltransferase 2-like domain-containing protein n=1 Tax=Candidatus Gottesmanbacteria bacterium RIFCSPLOWO2_01_FULL_49_10 TaxID=1798396 RepID=A0A1F6AWN0_9BACT|nr:MAG: Glycosyl transferase family 2 [Microgenomates group bacterium GW2011_GWA2_47_8]OGG29095.1 MAG: hypothetical protein A2973_00650 [Candidatus Gottesmanbacteria bacterium RIFCSPLOWO2_01_FULL_49_10]
MTKVSIIILNYNGCRHTVDCLRSLAKISFVDYEIILYDNGSSDDTAQVVKKTFKHVRIIKIKQNVGYCKGTNDAYRYARGQYVLLLNNDTIVTKDFLTTLVRRMEEDPNNGIVQPKLIFQKTKKLQAGCTFFTNTGFLYYFGHGKDPNEPKYNVPMQMHSVNGACTLVKREVIEKIGLFDEDFFLYFEETDFCHRALLAGYKIWYEPKAVVYHLGGMDNSTYKYSQLVYNATRNRLMSYLKNLEAHSLLKVLPVHLLLNILSLFGFAILGKPENSLAVLKALMYNVSHLRSTWHKRVYVQTQIRRLPDNDFLPEVRRNPRLEYYTMLFNGLERYKD